MPGVQTLPETSVTALDESYAQTLLAPFYPELTHLGISVEEATPYSYGGTDARASRAVIAELYAQNEGFCEVRGGTYRVKARPYVLVLAAHGEEVRGVVYDESRTPQLSYAYFAGRSLRALAVRRCA